MDNKISSDERGELRCSALEVPVFTFEAFEPVITLFIIDITSEQWMLLTAGQVDRDTIILLSDLCHELVEVTSNLVVGAVVPQVESMMHIQTTLKGASNSGDTTTTTNRTEIPPEWNYHGVTEEDIQASIGNSLHRCFGAALGVEQKRSQHSDALSELFGAEVKKRVNRSLAAIKRPTSSRQSQVSAESENSNESHTENMVYHIIHILGFLMQKSIEDAGCLDGDSDTSSTDELMEVEEIGTEVAEMIHSVPEQQRPGPSVCQSVKRFASYAEELPQRGKTFLAVFLGKLLDHIAHSTKTSILDMDFDGMLERLRETTVGQISSTLPQSVGNFHIPIYEELCREFGSAKLLQAAIVSRDVTFEEAVARTLKAQLQKSSETPSSFATKVRRFFSRKTRKVTPVCEFNTSVSHSEVINLENGSTPPPPPPPRGQQKCAAIMRMFSSATRILKKPFTSCISDGSQDY